MAARRVFISFDAENDGDLRNLLAGQAKHPDSPFEITNWSVKYAFTGDWEAKVRSRIKRVDQVAVICGLHTDAASGVSKEIRMAREERKPYFLLKGRATGRVRKPKAALTSDKIYSWTWPTLKKLIGGAR